MKQDTKDFHYSWYEIKRTGYAYSIRPLQDPPVRLEVPCTLRGGGTARAPLYAQFIPVRLCGKIAKYYDAQKKIYTNSTPSVDRTSSDIEVRMFSGSSS